MCLLLDTFYQFSAMSVFFFDQYFWLPERAPLLGTKMFCLNYFGGVGGGVVGGDFLLDGLICM